MLGFQLFTLIQKIGRKLMTSCFQFVFTYGNKGPDATRLQRRQRRAGVRQRLPVEGREGGVHRHAVALPWCREADGTWCRCVKRASA